MRLIRTSLGLEKPTRKREAFLHELTIMLAFCAFTAALTWPYVNYLRDAVADPGDPYLASWVLWWDYHQTFTDPLNLFQANLFYPFRYTLAFSEHCYGIALLFFPLFALGFRPLTVHAVAMFFGFALCGYSAFRLARTLTGSEAVAWVSGIVFAFVPFRFSLLSHLIYLFTPWIPLQFEALVLFVRQRSKGRAVWLGVALFMNGLTSVSWFTLSLIPFGVFAAILLTRYSVWRDRQFWIRGLIAAGVALIALFPFMWPYYQVSKLYGFKRSIEEIKANSAWPSHWLSAEYRNKLWNGMGTAFPEGYKFRLFPGLLPILFSLAAMIFVRPADKTRSPGTVSTKQKRLLNVLDVSMVTFIALAILTVGFDDTPFFAGVFNWFRSERILGLLLVALIARFCIAYPAFLTTKHANLVETLRSDRRNEAFWLGLVLTAVGFCYSLGWNFFFYRLCYDLIFMFRSMRVPPRGSIFAYLGLALLAGLGVKRLAELIAERRPRITQTLVVVIACGLLLFELNAAPLKLMRGDINPDAVTLRLKQTPMRGGLVVLPAGANFNHHHMLRSADHQKPLIVGTSGFNSTYEEQIEWATVEGRISDHFMDLLEKIPTSYLVIENDQLAPERRVDYETFLTRATLAGKLRFINRFDDHDDLYAVVKTEPEAKAEAKLPFVLEIKDWQTLVEEDPVNILGEYRGWSQRLYRIHVATYGQMPRYADFLSDVRMIGRGVTNDDEDLRNMETNLQKFAAGWVKRPKFLSRYKSLSDERYVDTLSENARISLAPDERNSLIDRLKSGDLSRDEVLLKIIDNDEFAKQEENRSLVLLHYFGYLHRNPDDPPDNSLAGFNFWIHVLETSGETARLTRGFMASGEFEHQNDKQQPASASPQR
jgi:hypothetical protein